MNILLVIPGYSMFPVGASYIYTALKQAGYSVDSFIFNRNPEALYERLIQKKYDLVAMGGLSIEYKQLKVISDIVNKVGTKIIAGGGIITSEPELMSRALNIDFAVIGEGEETIIELLSCIKDNGDLSLVNGIGYFKDELFTLTKSRKQIENLDSLPFPDHEGVGFIEYLDSSKPGRWHYFDIFDYPREYPLMASRSCPFLCTFCYHPTGNKYRQRSIDSLMAELAAVIPKYKINLVSIYDELFSYGGERVREFCKRFKDYAKTIPWEVKWGCQLRVDDLSDGLLDEMRSAGCFMVGYGLESYSPVVLKSMKKYISPQQIHKAVHATMDSGISISGNFIFGDKDETFETAITTLDFWKNHPQAGIRLGFIMACPQSELYQYAVKNGLIKDKLDFIANRLTLLTLNLTAMSDADFSKLIMLVIRYKIKYSPYSIPIKLTNSSITIRCPHCKKITEYKNFSVPFPKKLFNSQMLHCRKCRKIFYSLNRLYMINFQSDLPFLRFLNTAYYRLHKLSVSFLTERFLVLVIIGMFMVYSSIKSIFKKEFIITTEEA